MSLEQLSFFEKLQVLFSNILAHPLFLIILLMPVVLLLLKGKHGKKIFIAVYLLVIIFVLFIGNNVIFELFDNMMDGLFMTLYFPNFITLFVVVVLCSIIALISFFDKKMYKINKIINITGFAIVQFMFVLILTTVRSNNINIYADNALYSNSDVLTLMQLLMGAFALQIISILIINGINKVTAILDRDPNQRNIFARIKKINLDDNKIGYINVKDGKNPKKTKLKPFSFDLSKIEEVSVKSSKEAANVFESKPDIVSDIFEEKPLVTKIDSELSLDKIDTDDNIKVDKDIVKVEKNSAKKNDIEETTKNNISKADIEKIDSEKSKKFDTKKSEKLDSEKTENSDNLSIVDAKEEILPDIVLRHRNKKKEKVKPKITAEILKKEIDNKIKEFEGLSSVGAKAVLEKVKNPLAEKKNAKVSPVVRKIEHYKNNESKKVLDSAKEQVIVPDNKYADIQKPDLMKPMDVSSNKDEHRPKFINDANRTLAEEMFNSKPVLKPVRPYSISNLNIINMQLTLDTVIKYKFQRGVKLRRYDESPTIDDLNIFDFDKLMKILPKSKFYRKIGK